MRRRDAVWGMAAGMAAAGVAAPAKCVAGAPDSTGRKRTVRFAHLTDVHVHAGRSAAQGLAAAIQHVHNLSDPPAFIINGGDAINDALEAPRETVDEQWKLWHAAWRQHGALPVRHCLGNHDVWGWNRAKSQTTGAEPGWGKQAAMEQLRLETPYYRFDHGRWRFIVLDSLTLDEETAYRAELDQVQFAWLTRELAAAEPDVWLVIVSHIPIVTVGAVGFSAELRKAPQAQRMLSHGDASQILELLRRHPNVKLCLSGHTHLTEKISFAGIDFVNSGAVSGLWWKGDFLHTDEGYRVIDLFDDGTYQTDYISYGWVAEGPGKR